MDGQNTSPPHYPPTGYGPKPAPFSRNNRAWKSAFNAIEDWICIIDTQFSIRRSNQAVETTLNLPMERIIGCPCYTLIHNRQSPAPDCPMPRMLATGKRAGAEMELDDGRWIQVTLDPILDRHQRICGAVHIARDITCQVMIRNEQKILVKDLKQALGRIKTLNGLIPLCSSCKKIRDEKGEWDFLETYIERNSHASFSHGLCPDCMDSMYGRESWYKDMKKK